MEIISQETIQINIQRAGRLGNPIIYSHVIYYGSEYTIMKVKYNNEYIKAVIDTEDFIKIKDYNWHYTANSYISHTIRVDGKQKALYLHNIVMNQLEHPGKGSRQSIDHINRNGLDNRKENLRLITQSEQNINQKQKERRIELPVDSEISIDDIPKHIWYIKSNGSHGDRFGIDLKTENIKWKTTSAKNISLKDKLNSAKEQLQQYYKLYPYLNPNDENKNTEFNILTYSYQEIIQLSEQKFNKI
jgi:hypothetical protein